MTRGAIQFSLWHILVAITCVSFCLGLCVAPDWLRQLVSPILWLALCAVAVSAVIHGKDLVRAFWIGVLVPQVGYVALRGSFTYSFESQAFVILIFVSVLTGGLSYFTAWWITKND
jgi:hypothetical protein